MGSNHFANCTPEDRFFPSVRFGGPFDPVVDKWHLYDFDRRRCFEVVAPQGFGKDNLLEAAVEFVDDIPDGVVRVELSGDGSVVSTSSGPGGDHVIMPFYPPRTDFPRRVPTVRRAELTEVDRLGVHVDLVTYTAKSGEARRAVFKYYINERNVGVWWHEANCVMRMPRHPNIISFDALVVDKIKGEEDRVVGFTTRYIPGGTLHVNKDRVFKLKYLQQLISAVDHLNLLLGIVHGDICPWNLLIDPDADAIQLFDFNCAAKLGCEGDPRTYHAFAYDADRNDVKFVVLTLYELITREFCFREEYYPHELDAADYMGLVEWAVHPDARLDSPVEEYRRVLGEWVGRRAEADEQVSHFSRAERPLDWPPLHVPQDRRAACVWLGLSRGTLVEEGKGFFKWERPSTSDMPLPEGQRLLATGEIVSG